MAFSVSRRVTPFANERCVVGDHYSHGSSARTVVPCVGRLSISSVASSTSSRSRRPASPDPVAIRAPPTPSSVTVTPSTPDSRMSVKYGQDSDPQLFEDQSECPPRVRVRPLEVGAEKGECGRGEQPRRSPPPRPSQGDEGRCGQSPGNSHVCGDSRLRYVRLNAQCTDGEPCCHDEGSNDHGVAHQSRVGCVAATGSADVTRAPQRSGGGQLRLRDETASSARNHSSSVGVCFP